VARLWQVPGYVALAREAAAILGAHSDAAVRAILAHWACEQPSPAHWPPVHRNPGNLTRSIGTLDGTPHALATSAPGAGFLYVYATPEAGAAAYARYVLHSSRYGPGVAALRRGDAVGYLTDVCTHGYGTRLRCCLDELPAVTLPPAPRPPVPAAPRWACTARSVNVRATPSSRARIVGTVRAGTVVRGRVVTGSAYVANGRARRDWIALGGAHFTAAGFYRRLD
jgi:hypothetical protein